MSVEISSREARTAQPLAQAFYAGPTLEVARALLGCWVYRQLPEGGLLRGRIVEVEAYLPDDPASHVHCRRTRHSLLMFGAPGISYIYPIYGMYHCFNVVTEPEGLPAAVLIRGLDHIEGANGPGRLCRVLGLSRAQSGLDVTTPVHGLWLEAGALLPDDEVMVSGRIGLSRAQDLPLRLFLRGNPGVTKHPVNKTAVPAR